MVENQEELNISGNRVYHIDRECYVLYLGKADRKYRPFLRIGTSPYLPSDIRRHISSVLLTDRLTGDYFIEGDCLEKPVSHHMHYVGSHDLVDAVKHFIRNEKIAEHPLKPGDKVETGEGSRVVFYDSGNVRIMLDGHRLFDLLELERSHNHQVHVMNRLQKFTADQGYSSRDFTGRGFIILNDGSPAAFRDGILESLYVHPDSTFALAETLIPPKLLHSFGGSCDRNSLLGICKWQKLNSQPLYFRHKRENDGMEEDFITFMKQAGAEVKHAADNAGPEDEVLQLLLKTGNRDIRSLSLPEQLKGSQFQVSGQSLPLPGEEAWAFGIPAPLLKAVPYEFTDRNSSQTAGADSENLTRSAGELEKIMGAPGRDALARILESDPSKRRKTMESELSPQKLDDPARISLAFRLWNELQNNESRDSHGSDLQFLHDQLVTLHSSVPLPVRGLVSPTESGWKIFFVPASNGNRRTLKSIPEIRAKVKELRESLSDRGGFDKERVRLSQTLAALLKTREVQQVGAPKPNEKPSDQPSESPLSAEDVPENAAAKDTREADEGNALTSASPETSKTADELTRAAVQEGQAPGVSGTNPPPGLFGKSEAAPSSGSKTEKPSGGRRILGFLGIAAALAVVVWLLFLLFQNGGGPTIADSPSGDQTGDQSSTPQTEQTATQPDAEQSAGDSDAAPEDPSEGTQSNGSTGDASAEGTAQDSSEAGENADGNETSTESSDQPADINNRTSPWTIEEVLRVTNLIAYSNGFALLGEPAELGRNPDWIFPGNNLELPDGTPHNVEDGEMLWSIADSFITRIFRDSGKSLAEFREFLDDVTYNSTGDFKNF
ncbi:hypothetical protein [Salinispira pacifica]|uniref:Uncharacterized protein n=1 Tax=Salinispira pacifica TaxID=1307761 RepID=V5WKH2_9SPIO|nr:hypothetical protein [Salinispira pacifica]AHC15696.1 hypothetical protein L21SP2_2341 [Salinispira pacifica]